MASTTTISNTTTTIAVGNEVKLSSLQDRCKRDPDGYRQDYDEQIRRLQSEIDILLLSPSSYSPTAQRNLTELIQFAAAVSSSSYKGKESDRIASMIVNLLTGNNITIDTTSSTTQQQNQRSSKGTKKGKNQKNGQSKKDASGGGGGGPSAAFLSNICTSAAYIGQLHKDIRRTCVSALILMRNKGVLPSLTLLELFFQLMSTVPDKHIRETCYKHLVNDIRNQNKTSHNEHINRTVQGFLHRVVITSSLQHRGSSSSSSSMDGTESPSDIAARKSVDMVCDLYRRKVWTDERTVSILASAVDSPITNVMVRAMRFFLNIEEKMAQDRQHGIEEDWGSAQQIQLHKHSGKTKKRQRHVQQQLKARAKEQKKRELALAGEDVTNGMHHDVIQSKKLYPAIELLHDPQGLAEHVFRQLKKSNSTTQYKFEVKVLMINFVTRLVGNHELLLLPLYPFLQKYLSGTQRDVTAIMAYSVQACHEYVPPDELYGLLKCIAHNFITERCSSEQMAVGINAARAICARCPSVLLTDKDNNNNDDMNEHLESKDNKDGTTTTTTTMINRTTMDMEGFAQELAAYSKHRDQSVRVAGKSWMNFVREVYPTLLAGKDRGSHGTALHRAGEKPLQYGQQNVAMGVKGADLLLEYEQRRAAAKSGNKASSKVEGSDDEGRDDGDDDAVDDEDGWEEVEEEDEEVSNNAENEDANDDAEIENLEVEESDSDSEAPELVNVDEITNDDSTKANSKSLLSKKERQKVQQEVSSTRIFSTADFEKMRKLVARAEREKRDPRAAARRKRAEANGESLDLLSDEDEDGAVGSDSDGDDDGSVAGGPRIAGRVDPDDIMAEAKRKRQSKAEKLAKIMEGREKFQHKQRAGSSTNTEKSRRKNFLMQKYSRTMRAKKDLKETAIHTQKRKASSKMKGLTHVNKKRRRKL